MSKMIDQILNLFSYIPMYVQYLVLPLLLFIWLWKSTNKCKLDWVLKVTPSLGYMTVSLYTASWDITTGFYAGLVLFILVIAGAVLSLFRLKGLPFFVRKGIAGYMLYTLSGLIIFITAVINVTSLRACFYGEKPVELSFPFKNGTYYVVEGGDGKISNLMNYHYQNALNIALKYNTAERYANDIIELNSFGSSVKSFTFSLDNSACIPGDLNQYEIFGETLYSPCDGEVFYVQDYYPDNPITGQMYAKATGNGIVIKYQDVFVMMWHLKKGSITVKAGDRVTTGQPIGQIGNSGITRLPHLHIMASRVNWLYGTGVPIIFDGKNPIKHSLFIK